jgi:hypothetical protein
VVVTGDRRRRGAVTLAPRAPDLEIGGICNWGALFTSSIDRSPECFVTATGHLFSLQVANLTVLVGVN